MEKEAKEEVEVKDEAAPTGLSSLSTSASTEAPESTSPMPPMPPPPMPMPKTTLSPAVAAMAQKLAFLYNSICRIDDLLYIGNASVAASLPVLEENSIRVIVNVTPLVPNKFEDRLEYHRIPVDDLPMVDLRRHFDLACDVIAASHSEGKRVLVHCQAGVSRSATVCIAYIMRSKRIPLSEAHEQVQNARRLIRPNNGFWRQLIAYEESLFGTTSVELQQTSRGLRITVRATAGADATAAPALAETTVAARELQAPVAHIDNLLVPANATEAAGLVTITDADLPSLASLAL